VAVLIRLMGMADAASLLPTLLVLLAMLSMTFGNLAALVQTDLKRLLAFSSISHAGYMTMGILTGSISGYAGAMYYVGGYVLMNLALFYVIYNLSPEGKNVTIGDLRGLHQRSPMLALALAVGAFGLAGIPPTAGFAGKFFVLTAALQKGYLALVIVGAINTAIAIYYYLRIVRSAYTADSAADAASEPTDRVALSAGGWALGLGFVVSILVVGTFPGPLMDLFRQALTWMA
jgi:NADH-quinone oxidoreductase subunit N